MDRRSFLTSVAGGAAGAAAAPGLLAGSPAAAAAPFEPPDGELLGLAEALRDGPLMPLDRVRRMMATRELDGLLLVRPLHVYHAANFWPLTSKMGHSPSCAVLISRREGARPILVIPQFTFYYVYADGGPRRYLDHVLYTAPDLRSPEGDAREALVFALAEGDSPGLLERRRLADLRPYRETLARDFATAVGRAARTLGWGKGAIGIDDPVGGALLAAAGVEAPTRDVNNALARVRLVKSPLEIRVIRLAASRNVEAAQAAVRRVRDGMPARALREQYYAEAARRGMHGVFMVVDRVSDELYAGELREGTGFLIDCVAHLQHYHGDYGRTVFLGEPPARLLRATQAMTHAWNAIREQLKPGLRYSEVRALGAEAVKKGGYGDLTIVFNPHSVGLSHTDEPRTFRNGLPEREDLVLEPGMVLSIDCPLFQAGLGGSAHLEDLTLITRDGSEPLHPTGDEILIV